MTETEIKYFEQDRLRLLQLQKLGLKPRNFFDVGASNGSWSVTISPLFPEAMFYMFEPLVDLAPSYREVMDWVLVNHPRLRLHKIALGEKRHRTKMFFQAGSPAESTTLNWRGAPSDTERPEIEVTTLDDAIRDFNLPVPDVIKVDIQGGELSVLKGARATLPKVQALLLECWLWRGYAPETPLLLEVADWLRKFDFHLWDFGDNSRGGDGTLSTQDCVFLNASCEFSRTHHEPRRYRKPWVGSRWLKKTRAALSRPTRTNGSSPLPSK